MNTLLYWRRWPGWVHFAHHVLPTKPRALHSASAFQLQWIIGNACILGTFGFVSASRVVCGVEWIGSWIVDSTIPPLAFAFALPGLALAMASYRQRNWRWHRRWKNFIDFAGGFATVQRCAIVILRHPRKRVQYPYWCVCVLGSMEGDGKHYPSQW